MQLTTIEKELEKGQLWIKQFVRKILEDLLDFTLSQSKKDNTTI